MKRKLTLTLVSLTGLMALAGCGSAGSSGTNGGSSLPAAATTFSEQLQAAGISLTHEDPNPGFEKTEGGNADAELTTGGSNKVLYGAASITSYDELLYRASLSYKEYSWKEVTDTEKTTVYAAKLADAAKLENAKYVTDLFPNDGKNYEISVSKNAIGTKTFATADATGTPNIAVFGAGFAKDTSGSTPVYYVNATYLTSGITTTNLLNSGKGTMLYYEYNYVSFDKMGPGKRNYGCRVDFEVDFANTKIMNLDYSKTDVTEKGNAPEYSTYSALVTRLVFTSLKTLG